MLSASGKEEFEDKKKSPAISFGKKSGKKTVRISLQSEGRDQKADNHTSGRITKKANLSDNLPPIRKEKVKEAKRKKQKGDYDRQEVYKKIADRLMDLFGV